RNGPHAEGVGEEDAVLPALDDSQVGAEGDLLARDAGIVEGEERLAGNAGVVTLGRDDVNARLVGEEDAVLPDVWRGDRIDRIRVLQLTAEGEAARVTQRRIGGDGPEERRGPREVLRLEPVERHGDFPQRPVADGEHAVPPALDARGERDVAARVEARVAQ